MKTVIIYIVASVLIMVAILMILGGSLLWSFIGFLYSGLLYVSGDIFPSFWRSFWVSNIKILAYFNCL